MNKDYIKEKWPEWQPKLIVLVCLIGAFLSGYASGANLAPTHRQLNYTPNNSNLSSKNPEQKVKAGQGSGCPVKGSSSHVYHLPGGAFYDRTTAAVCFQTEAEAIAAGYRKSSK